MSPIISTGSAVVLDHPIHFEHGADRSFTVRNRYLPERCRELDSEPIAAPTSIQCITTTMNPIKLTLRRRAVTGIVQMLT
jgi:hypothetical protein